MVPLDAFQKINPTSDLFAIICTCKCQWSPLGKSPSQWSGLFQGRTASRIGKRWLLVHILTVRDDKQFKRERENRREADFPNDTKGATAFGLLEPSSSLQREPLLE